MAPRVTVLMPVHNGERYLKESIDSILSQTFADFEMIVVDDASTDATADILESVDDPRVRVLRNHANLGIAASLNFGLAEARGEYIARLDADDLALRERLERQVRFLEAHPEVGLVGTGCFLIDSRGRQIGIRSTSAGDLHVRWMSLFRNPFRHSSVMLRRDVLDRHHLRYDESCLVTQDYDLWTRMLRHTKAARLGEPLIKFRVYSGSSTVTKRPEQHETSTTISLRTLREYLPNYPIDAATVDQIVGLVAVNSPFRTTSGSARVALARSFLDVLDAFSRLHSEKPELRALRAHEALFTAHYFLRPPLASGWLRVVARLTAMNPTLPWHLLAWGLPFAYRRIRGTGR